MTLNGKVISVEQCSVFQPEYKIQISFHENGKEEGGYLILKTKDAPPFTFQQSVTVTLTSQE